jgi:hypothetical protein
MSSLLWFWHGDNTLLPNAALCVHKQLLINSTHDFYLNAVQVDSQTIAKEGFR